MEVRYNPLKRGISAIPVQYPMKTRQMGAIPPSAILSRKGIARYGGVSRTGALVYWAAKCVLVCVQCQVGSLNGDNFSIKAKLSPLKLL